MRRCCHLPRVWMCGDVRRTPVARAFVTRAPLGARRTRRQQKRRGTRGDSGRDPVCGRSKKLSVAGLPEPERSAPDPRISRFVYLGHRNAGERRTERHASEADAGLPAGARPIPPARTPRFTTGRFFSKFPHDHPRRPPRSALTNRPHRTHDAQDGDEGEGPSDDAGGYRYDRTTPSDTPYATTSEFPSRHPQTRSHRRLTEPSRPFSIAG
jgi:hypothetical protein